jgi:8-oxo-dGTP pyrophosphatase MutT (NUDIX family)
MNNLFLKLEEEFSKPLPGAEAQQRMSPSLRRQALNQESVKQGGVLILLYPYRDSLHTVLIKRSEYEGVHSGQVSFPGGMHEKGDGSLADTALREAMEETGLTPETATVIGQLTPLHIPVSNILVFPFVAVSYKRPDFFHDPSEVQYLIETPIDELLNPMNCKTKIMRIQGETVDVPYFDIQDNHIWGATAMIISEFLEVIRKSDLTFAW